MPTAQDRIQQLARQFISELQEIARDELMTILGAGGGGGGITKSTRAAAAARMSTRPTGAGRGAKRSPDDLQALQQQFVAFIAAHPGLRIEQINKQLGTTTKDLALPIRKALAAKAITTKGQKRSTTYYASGGAGRAKAAAGSRGGRAGRGGGGKRRGKKRG